MREFFKEKNGDLENQGKFDGIYPELILSLILNIL